MSKHTKHHNRGIRPKNVASLLFSTTSIGQVLSHQICQERSLSIIFPLPSSHPSPPPSIRPGRQGVVALGGHLRRQGPQLTALLAPAFRAAAQLAPPLAQGLTAMKAPFPAGKRWTDLQI